ncbi:sensor histidine kinase [Streptomyces spiramenti]|uniref:histidine kinase n=1 Tax=Streptomyces spiramenti TaxID=2720606 RepID=A0ABX1AGA6_9ACTN|nr:sensor histidine kinase [Streptomyces spiramenti]NJP66217.1 sensor histidine kinase [Streptomyces spiramenti]
MNTVANGSRQEATTGRPAWRTAALVAVGPRTLREGAHLLLNFPVALATFVAAVTLLSLSAGLLVTFVGLPLLCLTLVAARGFGFVERARARGLLGSAVADPAPLRRRDDRRGFFPWMGSVLRSGQCWRPTVYTLVHLPWALITFSAVVVLWSAGFSAAAYPLWFWWLPADHRPGINVDGQGGGWIWDSPGEVLLVMVAGAVTLWLAGWLIRGMAVVDRLLVAGLLGPSSEEQRVRQLETGRSQVADSSAADLRRIERDLHDGAQARLVALAMDLGLAKEKLSEDPEAAARMVDAAHGEVKLALRELRDLARGIHPAILTDRGLGPALSAVASRCTVPVRVEVDLTERPAPAIEGIAYYTVSELLQNVSKHSRASGAVLDVWRADDRLLLRVADDGVGGAVTDRGSGLAGLSERLSAVDGMLAVSSPQGGPTTVSAVLPWRERGAG